LIERGETGCGETATQWWDSGLRRSKATGGNLVRGEAVLIHTIEYLTKYSNSSHETES
jgi:hypothetical protein